MYDYLFSRAHVSSTENLPLTAPIYETAYIDFGAFLNLSQMHGLIVGVANLVIRKFSA